MNSHMPVNLLANSHERLVFYEKFTTELVFSSKVIAEEKSKLFIERLFGENYRCAVCVCPVKLQKKI